jgi:AraC-like DNA-binding protein
MAYREWRAPLGGLAECAWTSIAPTGGDEVVEAILPDGCMDLFWSGSRLCVAGPDTAPHPYRRSPGVVTSGLRFRPGRLPALLGVPAADLRDTRIPLDELHPALARRATGRLRDAGGDARAVLAGLVGVARELPGTPPDPAVAALVARIDSAAPAAEVADALGWTPRTLHRRCLAAFGYGPAVLRRVLRFRRATALLGTGAAPADVAARTGYADQPHLSRELRALGGTSPATLSRSARAPQLRAS